MTSKQSLPLAKNLSSLSSDSKENNQGTSVRQEFLPEAWPNIFYTWIRVASLAFFTVSVGQLIDSFRFSWLISAIISILISGICAWKTGRNPALLQASQEQTLRKQTLLSIWAMPVFGSTDRRSTQRKGTKIAQLTESVAAAAEYLAQYLGPSFAAVTCPIIVIITIGLAIDGQLSILLVGLIFTVPFAVKSCAKLFRAPSIKYRELATKVSAQFHEILGSIGLLKLLGSTNYGRKILTKGANDLAEEMFAMLKRNQIMIIINDLLFSGGLMTVIIAWVTYDFVHSSISVGQAIAGILLSFQLYDPIDTLGRTFYMGMGGRPQLVKLKTINVYYPPKEPAVSQPSSPAALTLVNLEITRSDKQLFSNLNLHLSKGKSLAIVGPTGVGKSSLALAIQGLLPFRGKILLDNESCDSTELVSRVCTVSQRPFIFTGSIGENLRLGAANASDTSLWAALSEAGLADEINNLPDKLNTQLGEFGYGLSAGQLRRLGLARAFLTKPAVLILDEPTADLDRPNEALISAALEKLHGKATIIEIAHRLSAIKNVDQILLLQPDKKPKISTFAKLAETRGYFDQALNAEDL